MLLALLLTALCGVFIAPKHSYYRTYCIRIWIAFDQFVNAITGGHEDHTISGRAGYGRMQGDRFWTLAANFIDFLFRDPQHCRNAVERNLITSHSYRRHVQAKGTQKWGMTLLYSVAALFVKFVIFDQLIMQGVF